MKSRFMYTVDPSIFMIPPNGNVLHAANETDFTKPDVFLRHPTGLQATYLSPYTLLSWATKNLEEKVAVAPPVMRSDSATSHQMTAIKPEKLEETGTPKEGLADQQASCGTFKTFMKRIFKRA